ncbi:uncharacterized protein K460DRAFT_371864 [Cucurbitaria berberidis CBS 394.84]|uniref:NTF2-like protein n=1 Tax=Cucurbitaria berberidis CBS 394.84 TaxID=1168544 RepID=A0A9P4G6I5_9PLEO|nr:uncharacterized protein K460DRAFT_371864 [Cucurbitaria berberidis CBS 394.84]KAF1839913.1 hypothetical protein K460DRAFT_371864 [Cucurbitaria berberidis CBS 394.84]
MTLRDTYAAFLATPSTGALADNAALHYISTLTSIHDATAIIKHLSVQEKLLTKTKEKILDAIEGHRGLSVDVETTIEFNSGGGAYLPGLDDNFVADRIVTFPMVHMVHFDPAGKITQIRQYWDQGSLLRQLDVIGSRSRNWPIRDGKEQSRLIASSSAAAVQLESVPSSRPSTAASRGADDVSITTSRSRGSTNNALNDPHASLSLFQPRDISQEEPRSSQPTAPRVQSAKPPPREYSELFVGENTTSPSPSPQKIPVKAGGGKNYKANRLFEETEDSSATRVPMSVKTNAKKYDHFDFGDGEDTPKVRETARAATRGKHESHWEFEDFMTPHKTKVKTQPQAMRNFGWSDDEEVSPVRRPIIHKARPDADAHFDLVDDGTPEAQRKSAPTKGSTSNKGQGLYEDHVTHTTEEEQDVKRPLNDVTTAVENKNRSKDFGAHWDMTDDSPGLGKKGAAKKPTHETRKAMNTHWGEYQDSPENKGINIAGNGMGGRKGTEAAWSLYDDSPTKKENTNADPRGMKSTTDASGGKQNGDSFWDF